MKKTLFLLALVFSITSLSAQDKDWFHKDEKVDGVRGISTLEAYKWLNNRAAKDTILVAVIDSGVDEEHEDLKSVMWHNPKESSVNGIDEDKNGYTDDVFGWNFIGGKDGRNIKQDTYEITREVVRLRALYANTEVNETNRADYMKFKEMEEEVERKKEEFTEQYNQVKGFAMAAENAEKTLKTHLNGEIDMDKLGEIQSEDPQIVMAVRIFSVLKDNGMDMAGLKEYIEYVQNRAEYVYNTEFDPRDIVGDDINNVADKFYGNSDVTGPDASHGTHVSGIIAAARNNGIGMDGIASAVKIIAVRAVPNGDERDKDVANAIRYAVDRGARIINMSFGKGQSPNKQAVDEAIAYAESKNVLLIHAAGNDGKSIDVEENFPSPIYQNGTRPANWIEVGASGPLPNFVADFSNYGNQNVDIFAPGVDVYSTVPNNKYQNNQGTSMAAPMVAGVAALVLSHYPNLTAVQLKKVILDSAINYGQEEVTRPGTVTEENTTGEKVKFESLCRTGGFLNALTALKLAAQMR